MPSNDERREIAENLRNLTVREWCRYAEQFYELLKETIMEDWDFHDFGDVAERLADLIEPEERTCHVINSNSTGDGKCDACEGKASIWDDYCKRCGAKVVE